MLKSSQRKLLIDGDIVAYQISAACEVATKWDDDTWTLHASESESIERLVNLIENYKEILLCDNVVVALSDKDNFRKEVSPLYKFNRKNTRKPLTYKPLKDYMIEKYETVILKNLEADDVLGILATTDDGFEKVILTNDKDLRTIPSTVYFMKNDPMGLAEEIDKDTADLNFLIQTLTGDRVDGYSGCPKIGDKTAERLLMPHKGNFKKMWEVVVAEFKKQHFSLEQIIDQARLARILRNGEYNYKTKKPILWRP